MGRPRRAAATVDQQARSGGRLWPPSWRPASRSSGSTAAGASRRALSLPRAAAPLSGPQLELSLPGRRRPGVAGQRPRPGGRAGALHGPHAAPARHPGGAPRSRRVAALPAAPTGGAGGARLGALPAAAGTLRPRSGAGRRARHAVRAILARERARDHGRAARGAVPHPRHARRSSAPRLRRAAISPPGCGPGSAPWRSRSSAWWRSPRWRSCSPAAGHISARPLFGAARPSPSCSRRSGWPSARPAPGAEESSAPASSRWSSRSSTAWGSTAPR